MFSNLGRQIFSNGLSIFLSVLFSESATALLHQLFFVSFLTWLWLLTVSWFSSLWLSCLNLFFSQTSGGLKAIADSKDSVITDFKAEVKTVSCWLHTWSKSWKCELNHVVSNSKSSLCKLNQTFFTLPWLPGPMDKITVTSNLQLLGTSSSTSSGSTSLKNKIISWYMGKIIMWKCAQF